MSAANFAKLGAPENKAPALVSRSPRIADRAPGGLPLSSPSRRPGPVGTPRKIDDADLAPNR